MSVIPARNALETASDGALYGDAAGEYQLMQRGRYSAWLYVGIAFVLEVGAIGGAIFALDAALFTSETARAVGGLVGVAAGLAGAWWIFRDRWRCIEAISSGFCSGLANLSIMYVP